MLYQYCSDLLGVVFAVAVTVGGAAHPVEKTFSLPLKAVRPIPSLRATTTHVNVFESRI